MLHKLSGSYSQIAKHIPELAGLLSSSANKKQQLLEMARAGEPRPSHGTLLKKALIRYANKESKSKSYDPKFAKEIRRIRPDWFWSTSQQNKKLFLAMAKKGEPKPSHETALYKLFYSYTLESSRCYDSDFTRKIMRLAPYWFLTKSQPKKDTLLEIARRKGPKPKEGDSLCNSLRYYMKSDPKFAKKIKKLAPHWFKRRCSTN
jgi:hypothetical protein